MAKPNFSYERKLWNDGFSLVAGVDEVGRGAWAGPLYAAAVVFPPRVRLKGINDSKKLSPERRLEIAFTIKEKALFWSVASVGVGFIEGFGVSEATQKAMRKALEALRKRPDFVLVDYFKLPFLDDDKHLSLKFGDSLSASIAAASILAKVARDNCMIELSPSYPQYGFEAHKGYGTKVHQEKVKQHGPCEIHRKSFLSNYI